MMTRDDLIILIIKIKNNEGGSFDIEKNIDCLLNTFLDPNALDYIFYDDLEVEIIADRIMAYKPVIL